MYRALFRVWPLVLLFVGTAIVSGCSGEGIAVHEVPYQKQRLLGAMVESENSAWFFKLMGSADDVTANREPFLAFVRSLRFPAEGKEPVTWTLPEGWTSEPATGMRYATLYIPRDQVVTVSRLGAGGGGLVANLNRWRDQMKLPPIRNEAELEKQWQRVPLADGLTALVIELESARGLPEMPQPEPAAPTGKPLEYQTPPGWKEVPDGQGMALVRFLVENGNGQRVDVTVTPLGGSAGGLVENVNRWRRQVGLQNATAEQIKKDAQSIEVGGDKCVYVDLVGPEGANKARIRMLAVICPRGERTWFLKMIGLDDTVCDQKPAFEAFVRSLRFGGGN